MSSMLRPAPSLRRPGLVWLLALCLSLFAAACDDTAEGGPDAVATTDTGVAETSEPDTVEPDTAEPDTAEPDTAGDATDTGGDAADTEDDVEDDTTDADTTPDVEDVEVVPPGCGTGSVLGRVCTPDGEEWLSNVQVTIETTDCDGVPTVIQDFTDEQGFFELAGVPAGTHTLTIVTGSYTTSKDDIRVEAGKPTDLTGEFSKLCFDNRSANIAVLTGVFDHVEALLDGMGVQYDLFEGDSADINPNPTQTGYQLLQDRARLLEYDIVIINSGEWYRLFNDEARAAEIELMRANLDAYVQNGGSLFVTDWAYYWAEAVYPGAVQFYDDPPADGSGVYTPGEEGPAKVGKLDPDVAATIESDTFRAAIGDDTMNINFNWAAWVVATGANFQSEVHVLATQAPIYPEPYVQPNAPLVVSYKPTPTSGTVFWSAFHAAVQPTDQMEDVLKFIVFQL